jgi:ketosteroid isomerase-like protein
MDRVSMVRDTWAALASGDLAPLEAVLAPDARWLAVEDGPWNCESAQAIVDVMGRNLANGLSGAVDDAFIVGDRVVVAFRPDQHANDAWPLDDGIRYVVVSTAGDLVTEIRGCPNREAALAYASAGQAAS